MDKLKGIHKKYLKIGNITEITSAAENAMEAFFDNILKFGTYGIVGIFVLWRFTTIETGVQAISLSGGLYGAVKTIFDTIPEFGISNRLENDPIDLRYFWMEIITKVIVAPVTLVYLLRNTLKISLIFTLLTFAISLIKLVVPMAVRKLEAKYDRQVRQYKTGVRTFETEMTVKPYIIKMLGLRMPLLSKMDELY